MRFKEVFLCLAFLILEVALQAADFSNKLSQCIEIKDVNECLIETMHELRALMPVGIPELGLRRSEPFEIDNLVFNSDPGIVDVRAKFSNVVVRGLSKFQTNHINADLQTRSLSIGLSVPRMDITGNYIVDGQVIIFRVNGAGDFISSLYDVNGNGRASISNAGPPGQQHLVVKDIVFDFQIGRANVRMNNLFHGELPQLAKRVNSWISENSDLVIDAVKPQIKREVTVIMERVLNDAFRKVPAENFIRNLERKAARESSSSSSISHAPSNTPPRSLPINNNNNNNNGFKNTINSNTQSHPPPPPPVIRTRPAPPPPDFRQGSKLVRPGPPPPIVRPGPPFLKGPRTGRFFFSR